MTPHDRPDAIDQTLAALDGSDAPAMFAGAGAGGAIVWTNPAGRALVDGLDDAARRTLARIAASGSEGLARLRIGAAGRPVTFRCRRARLADGARGTLLVGLCEAASASSEHAPRDRTAEAAHDASAVEAPEVEGAAKRVGEDAVDGAPAVVADSPPDPRTDLAVFLAERPANGGDASAAVRQVEAAEELLPRGSRPASETADQPALRFVFEIDADARLAFLSPDLAAAGAVVRDAVGRPWPALAAELALDPDGALTGALDRREGWRDIPMSWPTEDGGRLALLLTADPTFDRGGGFVGHRGLGRRQPAQATPREPQQPAAEATAAEAPAPGPREPAPAIRGANVVSLRDDGAAGTPALSQVEVSAFDEIARRLRGLAPGDAPEPDPAVAGLPETADADQAPPQDGDRPVDDVDGAALTASTVGDLLRLVDRLPVGALVLRAGAIVYANRAALDMTGHPDLASLATRGADQLFDEQPPRDDAAPATLRLIARDGVEVEVEARLSTIAWRGAPAVLIALKRVDEALAAVHGAQRRERELSAILDTATDGVLTLDGAGRILTVNRSAEALFGFEARDVLGSLFTLSLAPESRRAAFDYLDGLKANGVAALLNDGREVLGLTRQGGAIPLSMTIGRIGSDADGRFCAVLRDVTHWKKAEEELIAARRQAERASAQKSEFLAKVSHEIRTPLNAIIGFAEVIMEERFGPVGNARYKDYLRDIHFSGAHLIGLVNDLLDLSRVESGRLELAFAPVDLNEIVAQSIAMLQPQANRRHVIIRASLARSLPAVTADRKSVRQILSSLVGAAVKHSRPGGQVIVATTITDPGHVVIRVRDAGAGMTQAEIARAMEPFRPLQAPEADADAGLPLTRALAEANQAVLTMQSEPGAGTLVEVTFPASRVPAAG